MAKYAITVEIEFDSEYYDGDKSVDDYLTKIIASSVRQNVSEAFCKFRLNRPSVRTRTDLVTVTEAPSREYSYIED